MSKISITFALFIAMFAGNAMAWKLSCSSKDFKLLVFVDQVSTEDFGSSVYDQEIPKAESKVILFKDAERFEYKNNVFVIDEGQGNFQLTALALNGVDLEQVSWLYFDHEGPTISGYVKKPTFKVNSGELILTGFSDFAEFVDLPCSIR
jgi:hypothetical protein